MTNKRNAEIEQLRKERDAAMKEKEEVLANAELSRLEIERLNNELENNRIAMEQKAETARTEQMESTRVFYKVKMNN